jgi:H+/Cl- antiporter ClcA
MAELIGSQETNFFAGLVDFGFRQQQVRRLVKILYVIAVLGGFVAVVANVVIGFEQSQSQGLVALVEGIPAFFVWVLLSRLLLELALVMLRTAEGIERATHPGN